MSIPGLGQIPAQPTPSQTRSVVLRPFWEWRFEVSFSDPPVAVKLVSGTAEKDGTELALQRAYAFSGLKSKILTWQGCELEVTGACSDEFVAEYSDAADTPMASYMNLHLKLSGMRAAAAESRRPGPRVLIAGAPNSGKTSVARSLAAWATRMGAQPLIINANPREGMLTLPGTLSAAVFATLMDIESSSSAAGWGGTPTSGPAAVPVKLPLVYYYGREAAEDDVASYRDAVSRIAGPVSSRLMADPDVRSSGLIVDAPGFAAQGKIGVEILTHLVEEFSVNVVIVLSAERLYTDLQKRVSAETSSLGEPIQVVHLSKSEGVVERSHDFMHQTREAEIKEYFFGQAGRALSPSTQTVDMGSLVVYRASDDTPYGEDDKKLFSFGRVDVSSEMEHWTLAVMAASAKDYPETVRNSTVMGFVYIAHVDAERKKVRILAPVPGRLADRPLVWGSWPEPFFNLLG